MQDASPSPTMVHLVLALTQCGPSRRAVTASGFGERCRALHGIPRSLRAQLFRLFSPSNLISIVPCTDSRLLTAAGLPSVCGVSLAGVPGAPRAARALPLPDGRASTPTSSVSLDVRLFQTENLPLIHLCDFNNSNATLCSERISASPE